MEEKILITSKKCNNGLIVAAFPIIGILAALIMWYCWVGGIEYFFSKPFWARQDTSFLCISLAVAAVGIFLGGIISAWISRCEISVTDKRVYGKAAFGKRVDLPLDSISAVGSGWPKAISVATSSGRIAFPLVENCDEIHRTISNLLLKRQSKASSVSAIKQEIPQSSADELKKYKELLDSGVITQEEFDAKKKQLMGL